jgi:hypothetical protein
LTGHEILRAVVGLVIEVVGWTLSPILLALVFLPLGMAWDWLKRRVWPTVDDPEKRAQAQAWATLKVEAEERTRERHPRDPHILRLTGAPLLPSPSEDGPIRLS